MFLGMYSAYNSLEVLFLLIFPLQDIPSFSFTGSRRVSFSSNGIPADTLQMFKEPAYSFVGMHCIFDCCKGSGKLFCICFFLFFVHFDSKYVYVACIVSINMISVYYEIRLWLLIYCENNLKKQSVDLACFLLQQKCIVLNS